VSKLVGGAAGDFVTVAERKKIYDRWQHLNAHPEECTEISIIAQLDNEFSRTRATLYNNIRQAQQQETRLALQTENAKLSAIFGGDFMELAKIAQNNFVDALNGEKDMGSSQQWATKTILDKMERALMPKKLGKPAAPSDKSSGEDEDAPWATQ